MSAFYDQASLVVVPSGYKSGKIYAQKPLTTDGQLTFTRASTATRVNASGLIESVASGVPRLDYLGSSCPKILLEPQRSNLAINNRAFDNASWGKNQASVSADAALSPEGSSNADKIQEDNTLGLHYISGVGIGSAATYTFSVYLKAAERIWAFTYIYEGGAPAGLGARFNLSSGTVGAVDSGVIASIQSAGNGWYRCSITRTITANAGSGYGFGPAIDSAAASYTGTTGSGILAYGAQAEIGAYPTSLIWTTTAAVTRLEDAAYKTGISSLIGQTNGAFFVDVTFGNSRNSWLFSLVSNNWQNDSFYLETFGANNYISINTVKTGTAAGSASSTFAAVNGIRAKIAVQYTSTTLNLFINGVKYTGTRTAIPACTGLYIDELGTFGASLNQKNTNRFNQVLTFTSALTDAQCIELTTL
jgi:hypothetical protein